VPGSIATQGMINLAGEPIAGQVIPNTTVASTLGGHVPAGSSGLLGGLAGKIGSKELLALNMASSMFQQPQVQQQYYRNQREYAR
jgi:phosphopantothenoylcysteine synthetase/decarboxylase